MAVLADRSEVSRPDVEEAFEVLVFVPEHQFSDLIQGEDCPGNVQISGKSRNQPSLDIRAVVDHTDEFFDVVFMSGVKTALLSL